MALTKIDDRGLKTPIDLLDNEKIRFGTTDNDLEIFHDSNNSYIKDTGTGALVLATSKLSVNNAASNEELIVAYQNGSVELFYDNSKKFETTSWGAQVTGALKTDTGGISILTDSQKLTLGAGDDLQIFHSGSENFIRCATSASRLYIDCTEHLRVRHLDTNGTNDESMIYAKGDGAVELYYDGVKKLETTANGIKVPDSARLSCGDGEDLVIKHTGAAANIDNGTGDLLIRQLGNSGDIYLDPKSGERGIKVIRDGAVELYYDNVKKLETASEGVNVTGRTKWTGGTNVETQSVFLSAGASAATQIGMFNGHGVDQGFCFYNNGSSANKSWGMITNQSSWFLKRAAYNIGNASNLVTGWTNVLEANSGGDLDLKIGNLKVSSGKGIDFSAQTGTSATGAATGSDSDDELLDHYENGTWTPVADGAGTINGTSITYTGRYARVGQIVTVWFAASNSAGDIEIPSYKVFSGLPFTTGGWRSVGRVCTEDAEVTARCGDISCTSGTSIIINNSGSSSGTVNIGGTLTYAIS